MAKHNGEGEWSLKGRGLLETFHFWPKVSIFDTSRLSFAFRYKWHYKKTQKSAYPHNICLQYPIKCVLE